MLLLAAPPQPLLLPATVPGRIEPGRAFEIDTVTQGDALTFIRTLPSNSVNCVMTSPPYFGLRDYGVDGQWGLEPTPAEHVARMVELFREVRRVLRDDGVLWLNYGDSYANDEKWSGSTGGKHVSDLHGDTGIGRRKKETGIAPKNLIGMPWRVAFGLQDDGWILRSDIIWAKPNPMPESVTDRPTKAHEYVFLFSKSGRYWYDQEAVREPAINGDPTSPRGSNGVINNPLNSGSRADKQSQLGKRTYTGFNERWDSRPEPLAMRNLRTVWSIATEPTPFAHFATFPQKLVERCILAGCPRDGIVLDPFMGSGTVALVSRADQVSKEMLLNMTNPSLIVSPGFDKSPISQSDECLRCHKPLIDFGVCRLYDGLTFKLRYCKPCKTYDFQTALLGEPLTHQAFTLTQIFAETGGLL